MVAMFPFHCVQQAGHRIASDHNGEEQEGIHIAQAYIDEGRRCSASHAYLHPNKDHPNLAVKTNSHVHRVLFELYRATGIQLVTGEKLFANKEVIIAARFSMEEMTEPDAQDVSQV